MLSRALNIQSKLVTQSVRYFARWKDPSNMDHLSQEYIDNQEKQFKDIMTPQEQLLMRA